MREIKPYVPSSATEPSPEPIEPSFKASVDPARPNKSVRPVDPVYDFGFPTWSKRLKQLVIIVSDKAISLIIYLARLRSIWFSLVSVSFASVRSSTSRFNVRTRACWRAISSSFSSFCRFSTLIRAVLLSS